MPDHLISLKHCFNIILPYTATSSIRVLSLRFPDQNFVCTFYTAMNATFSKFNVVKRFTNQFFIFFALQSLLTPSALALVHLRPVRTHCQLRTFQTLGMAVSNRTQPSRDCPGRPTAGTGRQLQWGRKSRNYKN